MSVCNTVLPKFVSIQQSLWVLIPSTGKKAAKKLSDVEEDDEEDENQVPDLEDEEEGEKENEDLCNEGGSPVSKPKRQRKRKTRQAALNEEPSDKKNKTGENSDDQGTVAFTYFMKMFFSCQKTWQI